MEQRALGHSGLNVSVLGLGGIELGPEGRETPDVATAVRVIETARDEGITWIDTSENYCATRNEELIGEALAQVADGFQIATKVHPGVNGVGGSGLRPDEVHAACRASLRRLRRDHVDLYLVHWPDPAGAVPVEDTWGAMVELADSGLVRAIGLSNFGIEDVVRCHQARPIDVIQDGLSMVDHLDNRAHLAACADLGIGVTIYEPLAGGVLTGKTIDELRTVWSAWVESGFYQRLLVPGRAERCSDVVDELRTIADRIGATVPQVALAWVLQQKTVDCAIVGSRNGGHLAENAGAASLDLTDVMDELDALIPLGPAFA